MSAMGLAGPARAQGKARSTVRVGVVGTGGRGTGLLGILLGFRDMEVPALCDIDRDHLANAQALVVRSGRPEPEGYWQSEEAFRGLMERDDLDAVIIATPWRWHTPMAVCGMQCGKYVGVEVPCALSLEECWALVDTQEKTGVPCMMLENWSFRRDNLAVLNMIRAGLLGEIVHTHCAHSHMCIDHWFFDDQGKDRWPAEYLVKHNRDQYPTHSLGPVLSWMDINCGDRFDTVTSTATGSRAINDYFVRKLGKDHPSAKRRYKQGDIVTSVIRTAREKTIVVNYDMQIHRPYDNRWMVEGLQGVYDEDRAVVYLHGKSPAYDEWEPFGPHQERHDHAWYRETGAEGSAASHGGTDYLEMRQFVNAVRDRKPTPIDIYDSVTMSCLVALSEQSIAHGSAPVRCPDFTRGEWRTRKPTFAKV